MMKQELYYDPRHVFALGDEVEIWGPEWLPAIIIAFRMTQNSYGQRLLCVVRLTDGRVWIIRHHPRHIRLRKVEA